jgi:hypothetical protein
VTDDVGVELPRYPVSASEQLPDISRARSAATVLLAVESALLGLSLPIQLFMLLSLGWEGGNETLKHRLIDALPLLGLGALLTAVLAGVGATAVHRATSDARTIASITAGLTIVLAIGWLVGLRGAWLDPMWASLWLLLTAPPLVARLVLREWDPTESARS